MLLCIELSEINLISMKKKHKKMSKSTISIYPFWVMCDLMVNYMEIQDFVELPCISLLWLHVE